MYCSIFFRFNRCAGIRPGDVVLSVNGEPVSNVAQARAARAAFAQLMDMARRLNVVEQDFLQAAEWCATPGGKLRGGDALHLAIAQRHGCTHLASLDKDMQAAAQQQRMKLVEWT